jgi:glycosyltransferase involved in cell wall biosynthesis
MRYAYVKYGNVVDELSAFGSAPSVVPPGGPETFTGSFLQTIGNNAALLISWLPRRQTVMRLRMDSIVAQVYRCPNGVAEIVAASRLFVRLIIFRPHVAICVRDGWALWATYLACRAMHVPFIHSRQRAIRVNGDNWRRRVIAKIDGFAIRRAARIICHGPFTHRQLAEIGVPEGKIIEFDVHLYDILAEMHKARTGSRDETSSSRKKVFFLGRIEASKGVLDLLDACLPILKTRADVDLVYVGSGGALSLLQKRVQIEGVASRVEFAGRVLHSQIAVRLQDATVLVTPTRHGLEGWPMAALEGLAIGIPVIAPAAGPFPFMIKEGINGLLYTVNSVDDLQQKLQKILDDADLRRELARGAVESERRRAQLCKTFGEALSEAIALSCDEA